MRRKRIKKHDVQISSASYIQAKIQIKRFIKAFLPQIGLRSGVDFQVTDNNLKIKHYFKTVIGNIVITLKEVFPIFNFYWQTSRMLVWF